MKILRSTKVWTIRHSKIGDGWLCPAQRCKQTPRTDYEGVGVFIERDFFSRFRTDCDHAALRKQLTGSDKNDYPTKEAKDEK